jgi:hypothetical protein
MPNDTNYNIVIHKRNHQASIVAMSMDDFMELVQMLKANHIL